MEESIEQLVERLTCSEANDPLAELPPLDPGQVREVAEHLKAKADQLLHADLQSMLRIGHVLHDLAEQFKQPGVRALSLLVQANGATFSSGEYAKAVDLYDEASAIYEKLQDPVLMANAQIGKVFALANIGNVDLAIQTANDARRVFLEHDETLRFARLTVNLGILFGRNGDDKRALATFDEACKAYESLGDQAEPYFARAQLNRAIALRNLGRFDESIAACGTALTFLEKHQLKIDVAHTKKIIAITYILQSRFNEALTLLYEVRDTFLTDGRARDAVRVDLYIADCLLELGRYQDTLERCESIHATFSRMNLSLEEGQTHLDEAIARIGLHQPTQAREPLTKARQRFEQGQNKLWVLICDLERAALELDLENGEHAIELLDQALAAARELQIGYLEIRARVLLGHAYLARGKLGRAEAAAGMAESLLGTKPLPHLVYQVAHLKALLWRTKGQVGKSLEDYERALDAIERIRSHIMLDYRPSFLSNKEQVYDEAVKLALGDHQEQRAFRIHERAKSRALVELLSHNVELKITARGSEDRPLVSRIQALREERDQLRRSIQGERADLELSLEAIHDLWPRYDHLQAVEHEIIGCWHQLLVQNADYAAEATLDNVLTAFNFQDLPSDTLLMEYAVIADEIWLFLISQDAIDTIFLGTIRRAVKEYMQYVDLNLAAAPHARHQQIAGLERTVQHHLSELAHLLVSPASSKLQSFRHLLIIPHKYLHYLPFHALYLEGRYLIEDHAISFLPCASLLSTPHPEPRQRAGALVVGWDCNGTLPGAEEEASAIARILGASPHTGSAATRDALLTQPDAQIIHLATHGEFRSDNPLFSGLAFHDGWLSALDVFQLTLNASLVTLSACDTGRSVRGGGDELIGLMRAFFSAGASTILQSLWTVHDRSAVHLMGSFYEHLGQGAAKVDALQKAQVEWIDEARAKGQATHSHPYYWAPFMLVGDFGKS